MFKCGKDVRIVSQDSSQNWVDQLPIGLQIDQKDAFGSSGKNPAPILFDTPTQRVEVKSLQRALRFNVFTIVGDQEFAVHEVNVRFDAAEAVLQCIVKRVDMFVIIM